MSEIKQPVTFAMEDSGDDYADDPTFRDATGRRVETAEIVSALNAAPGASDVEVPLALVEDVSNILCKHLGDPGTEEFCEAIEDIAVFTTARESALRAENDALRTESADRLMALKEISDSRNKRAAERDALAAQVATMRGALEAAQAWVGPRYPAHNRRNALLDEIDTALDATPEDLRAAGYVPAAERDALASQVATMRGGLSNASCGYCRGRRLRWRESAGATQTHILSAKGASHWKPPSPLTHPTRRGGCRMP